MPLTKVESCVLVTGTLRSLASSLELNGTPLLSPAYEKKFVDFEFQVILDADFSLNWSICA